MFDRYRKATPSLKPNYKLIPVTMLTVAQTDEFNEVWKSLQDWKMFEFTESGGISKRNFSFPSYNFTQTLNSIELVVCAEEGFFRLQMRFQNLAEDKNKKKIYGNVSFSKFKNKCLSYGINLNDYIIDNGREIKETIEKPLITITDKTFRHLTITNAHHVDFHNSYPAGLANTHPEFRPVIEYFYKGRKQDESFKAVLNLTIGYMQSIKACNAKWAHLSRDAIADNNMRLRELARRIEDAGRTIIAYNTDGMWYVGDEYHGEGEGSELGQWENDHTNCTIRFKSAGAYEYIEDGVYCPVIRGRTKLDEKIDRSLWQWGDIYQEDAQPVKYILTKDGIMEVNYEEF